MKDFPGEPKPAVQANNGSGATLTNQQEAQTALVVRSYMKTFEPVCSFTKAVVDAVLCLWLPKRTDSTIEI